MQLLENLKLYVGIYNMGTKSPFESSISRHFDSTNPDSNACYQNSHTPTYKNILMLNLSNYWGGLQTILQLLCFDFQF